MVDISATYKDAFNKAVAELETAMQEREHLETEREGVDLARLEITTCLKRGEIEVVTRYEPDAEGAYEDLVEVVAERHASTLFSTDGSTVDEIVARWLAEGGRTIATAE